MMIFEKKQAKWKQWNTKRSKILVSLQLQQCKLRLYANLSHFTHFWRSSSSSLYKPDSAKLHLILQACWLRRLSKTAAVASFALGEVFRHWPSLDVAPPCFHWEWFLSVQLTPHSQHLGAEGAPHLKKLLKELPHSKGSGAGVQASQLWQQKDTLLSLQSHMQTLDTRSKEDWN